MPEILFQDDIIDDAISWCKAHLPDSAWAIVCDHHTYDAFAEKLTMTLIDSGQCYVVNLGSKPKPRIDTAEHLRRQTAQASAIIAVGSGTINDLCKYVAFRHDIPYVVFPTAPSMNGYISSTASLITGRQKSSVEARQPQAVFCDMQTLMSAPKRLIRAGFGDSICRATIQADWLLAHLLMGIDYDERLFEPLIALETELVEHCDKITKNDPAIIKLLMDLLLLSGQTMYEHGSSMPASQGEHMIAHTMEMLYGNELRENYHGEDIAVTTLAMARLQDKILTTKPVIKATEKPVEHFTRKFGKLIGEPLFEQFSKKAISKEKAEALNEKLESEWPQMKEQLQAVIIKPSRLDVILRQTHCYTQYDQLAWHKDRFEHAITVAHLTRDRFTFLDLASMRANMRYWFN